MSDEALEKSALLLLTLGSEVASEVLKIMGPREVQKVGVAMASLPPQPRARRRVAGRNRRAPRRRRAH